MPPDDNDRAQPDAALRADIRLLGNLLGQSLVRQSGRVEVDVLAERFEVSPQTIRKDLNDTIKKSTCLLLNNSRRLAKFLPFLSTSKTRQQT